MIIIIFWIYAIPAMIYLIYRYYDNKCPDIKVLMVAKGLVFMSLFVMIGIIFKLICQ